MHVVNFDLPNTQYGGIDEYIHRIGKPIFFFSLCHD
jgi:ATP-dependent RNA helicase DDX3X